MGTMSKLFRNRRLVLWLLPVFIGMLVLTLVHVVTNTRRSNALLVLNQLKDTRNLRTVGEVGRSRIGFRNRFPSWLDTMFGKSIAEIRNGGADCYDLSNTNVTDIDMESFKVLTGVRSLLLNNTSITDRGLQHLSACNLKQLQLPNTRITDSGLVGLAHSRDLQALLLCHTGVTGTGCRHLSKCDHLILLWLWDTECNDEGLAEICKLSTIVDLLLSDTKVTDMGVECLAQMPNLKFVDLSRTAITDLSVASLSKCHSLVAISLDDTALSVDAIHELQSALPRCSIRNRSSEILSVPEKNDE